MEIQGPEAATAAAPTATGAKVLVIDDSNTIRRSAEIFLRQGGHEVVLAEDGFDALAKVNDHAPELIFCDILMPRLDGYQTCAIIKRNPRFAHVPVIMLSSKDGLFDKARGRMVGSGLPHQAVHQRAVAARRRRLPSQCPLTPRDTLMPIQKILVVDDSKTELHHLSELLGKRGYTVRTAENGEEAMRRLEEEKPQLILMDVVMPGQNGFQLTRAITRDPRFSTVPVIMCTSKNQETDKVWGMRQGARDYIVKPVDATELMAKIHAFD